MRDGTLRNLVGATGFEPATLCSQSRCATRLRYAPTPKTSDFTAVSHAMRVRDLRLKEITIAEAVGIAFPVLWPATGPRTSEYVEGVG